MELIRVRRSSPSRRGATVAPLPAHNEPAPLPVRVRSAVKTFSRPRWLALHVIVAALTITMILLGRWQLTVSNEKHFDLQNFGYALQWWAFATFGLFMYVRTMRDHLRPDLPSAPSTGGTLVLATPGAVATPGPAWLTTPSATPGQDPIQYAGYVMPNSATRPARSDDDPYHGNYNDYLWQLALADQARSPRRPATPGPTAPASPELPGPDPIH